MRKGMISDCVPLSYFATSKVAVRNGVTPEKKEGGADAFILKRVKNAWRRTRPGPVIKSQNDLFRRER